MEIHQVRYFVAVSKVLNFTRAADLCGVTQPALTKAIQKLEGEFGGDLIVRERHLTHLTDLGKLVLPILETMLAAADAARASAHDFKRKIVAPLRIGLSPCISAALVADLLAQIAAAVPGLQVELLEAPANDIGKLLFEGEINAAFAGNLNAAPDRIDRWRLFEERFVVLARQASPLARHPVAPLSTLRHEAWIERVGCDAIGRLWAAHFEDGAPPRIQHRGRQVAHLHQMALAGLGLLLAAEHAPCPTGLVRLQIEGEPLRHQVELLAIAGRQYTPALDALIKIARNYDWSRGLTEPLQPAPAPRVSSERATTSQPAPIAGEQRAFA